MLLLTLTIGLLNLGLGFAAAVYLGYGPPGLAAAWQALGAGAGHEEEFRLAGEGEPSMAGAGGDTAAGLSQADLDLAATEARLLVELERLQSSFQEQPETPPEPAAEEAVA
jgi:hypothetical protein